VLDEPESYSAIEWFEPPAQVPEAEVANEAHADAAAAEPQEDLASVTPFELRRPLLGTLLLRDGLITPQQLAEALIEKEETEERLGEIVMRRGWITDVALSRLLAEQFAVVYVDLDATPPDDRAKRLLSAALARYFWAVPVRFLDNDSVLVAIADPTAFGVEDLERALGFRVVLGLATESAVEAAIERLEAEEEASRPRPVAEADAPASEEPAAVESVEVEPTTPESIDDARPADGEEARDTTEALPPWSWLDLAVSTSDSQPDVEPMEESPAVASDAETETETHAEPAVEADAEPAVEPDAEPAVEPQLEAESGDGAAEEQAGPADDPGPEPVDDDAVEPADEPAPAEPFFVASEPELVRGPASETDLDELEGEPQADEPATEDLLEPTLPNEPPVEIETEAAEAAAELAEIEPAPAEIETEAVLGEIETEPAEAGPEPIEAETEAAETEPAEAETEPVASAETEDHPAPEVSEQADEPQVNEVVDGLLLLALEEGASDLHFEPQANQLAVRARIDGLMQQLYTAPAPLAEAVVARLELIGGLDVPGRRPRNEQATFSLSTAEIDARVTIAPTSFGDRVVLRFPRTAQELSLDQLGLAPDAVEQLAQAVAQPYGAVIVAGPRESGTTTTLYAALQDLDAGGRCLMTIEDPVARQLPGVGQIQVDPAADLTFAQGLRTLLASDPDVVLVGDLGDSETARMAVEAAVTGQLVLAALRADDLGGAVSRLVEMGVGRELLAAATNCLVAQRLARKLCIGCREPYDMDVEELLEAGARETDLPVGGSVTLYRAAGCNECASGYRGRVAMFETLLVSSATRRLLETGTAEELHQAAVAGGMRTLRQDGLRLCLLGHTSVDEVKRVAGPSGA
jgi:type II secretory ATPase GspE/PulE/Tfp pilus assembly ATPase PilB-like protein